MLVLSALPVIFTTVALSGRASSECSALKRILRGLESILNSRTMKTITAKK